MYPHIFFITTPLTSRNISKAKRCTQKNLLHKGVSFGDMVVEIVARGKDEAAIVAGPGEASREVDVLHMFPR
jgi:hypothetical protein